MLLVRIGDDYVKTRLISAIVVILAAIPIFLIGGISFKLAFYVIAMLGLREYLGVRSKRKDFPIFIKLIAYICLTLIYFTFDIKADMSIGTDIRYITGLMLMMFLPMILYKDKNEYNINDACYVVSGVLLISITMLLMTVFRDIRLALIVLLFVVTVMTDTFAYLTGMLIGRHKLLESISPKKTWEGFIGGAVVATFVSVMFYIRVINSDISIPLITGLMLLLSIIGQLGDLFFSAIKRYYGVKDFSNIMPGHGGILDRLDSIIFVVLAYSLIITIL